MLVVANSQPSVEDSQLTDPGEKSFYDLLTNEQTVNALAYEGKQPLVKILAKHFKLLFLDDENAETSRSHLVSYLYR